MADPVSITLGVIPLIGAAIKSYTVVHKKFTTFVHYSSKLRRFQKRFKLYRRVFENECHLLLRFALDDEAVTDLMRADLAHKTWTDSSVDNSLKRQFGDNYESCIDTLQDICKAVDDIAEEFGSFDVLAEQQLEVRQKRWSDTEFAVLLTKLFTTGRKA